MKVKIEHASRHMWLFHNILLGRRKVWILGVGKEKDPVHKKLWHTQVRELAHKVCAVLPRHQELVCPSGPFQMSDSLTQAERSWERWQNPCVSEGLHQSLRTSWTRGATAGWIHLRLNEQGVSVVLGQVRRQLRALCFRNCFSWKGLHRL